jgi:hypothetical protein
MADNKVHSRVGRLATAMAAALALVAAGVQQVGAQAVDVTGRWNMEVTTDAGTTTPTMTLEQHGDHVSGHYSSETLGEADVEGSVTGNRITISFEASMQGQAVPVVYQATVDANGVMTGTIDVAGGLASGTFTARRAGE